MIYSVCFLGDVRQSKQDVTSDKKTQQQTSVSSNSAGSSLSVGDIVLAKYWEDNQVCMCE